MTDLVHKVHAISEQEETAERQTSIDVNSPRPQDQTISSRRESISNAGQRMGSYAPIPMREMRIQVKHQAGESVDQLNLDTKQRFFNLRSSNDSSSPRQAVIQFKQQIQDRKKIGRTIS